MSPKDRPRETIRSRGRARRPEIAFRPANAAQTGCFTQHDDNNSKPVALSGYLRAISLLTLRNPKEIELRLVISGVSDANKSSSPRRCTKALLRRREPESYGVHTIDGDMMRCVGCTLSWHLFVAWRLSSPSVRRMI
jgi:hypothetical protein